jgi:hypothetical protein
VADKRHRKSRPAPPPPPVRKKPPRDKQGRAQRRAVAEAERRSAQWQRRLGILVVALAAITVVGTYVALDRRADAELRQALTGSGCRIDDEADPTGPPGSNHVPSPGYRVDPPSAGDHLLSVARSGVYAGSAVPQDGQLVHALEHGYVILWHRPDLPEADLDRLEALRATRERDILVVERPSLPVAVAATAWQQRVLCPALDAAALKRFAQEYVGSGPEDQPRG